jgi:hypothetical protein
MSLIEVSQLNVPLIVFNSEDWGGKSYTGEVAEEIIKFFKKSKNKIIIIQNKAYSFGGTEVPFIIFETINQFK